MLINEREIEMKLKELKGKIVKLDQKLNHKHLGFTDADIYDHPNYGGSGLKPIAELKGITLEDGTYIEIKIVECQEIDDCNPYFIATGIVHKARR